MNLALSSPDTYAGFMNTGNGKRLESRFLTRAAPVWRLFADVFGMMCLTLRDTAFSNSIVYGQEEWEGASA